MKTNPKIAEIARVARRSVGDAMDGSRLSAAIDEAGIWGESDSAHEEDEWRTVPVPQLREFYVEEAVRVGLRRLADKAGVWPQTLQNFLNGSTPGQRIRRQLSRYFLARDGMLTDPTTLLRPRGLPSTSGAYPFAFPAEDIRDYLRFRAELESIRSLAPIIGLSSATVGSFLRGSPMRPVSAWRLVVWYERERVVVPPPGSALERALDEVSLDALAVFYTAERERTSLHHLSTAAGVGHTQIELLLSTRAQTLDRHSRRVLALYYLLAHSGRNGAAELPMQGAGA
jgi:hypothetical protein